MFNAVEYVRNVCRQRKIPIAQLEKDCGFANGYLNPKKLSKIPYDRSQKIADYLDLSLEYLLTGKQPEKLPAPESRRRFDIESAKIALFGGDSEVTDDMWEEAIFAAQLIKDRYRRKKGLDE